MAKRLAVVLMALGLSGCGSFQTLVFSDEWVAGNLTRHNTYCASIPRAYSGVAYNFCSLHSAPRRHYDSADRLWWKMVDIAFSGVVDTAALPYTVYLQHRHGSLEIY